MPPRLLPRLAVAAAALALGAACGNADEPVPGRELQRLGSRATGLVADTTHLYVIDFEIDPTDITQGHQVVRAVPRDGGPSARLYDSDGRDSYPRKELALTAAHVIFVDRCVSTPPAPTCGRLFRVPKAGGTAELLVEDRVYDVATSGETIYYTTSDEHGLGEGAPDGELWRIVPDGEPELLLGGLTHLRDVLVDSAAVYFVDTTPDGETVRLSRLAHGEGTPTTISTASGVGSARIFLHGIDADGIYYGALAGLFRASRTGGPPVEIATPPMGGIAGAAPHGDRVVWLDPGYTISEGDDGPSTYYRGALMASPRDGGPAVVLAPDQLEPLHVVADGLGVAWLNNGDGDRASTLRALAP